ncbi:MAG TPA: hypothetical protein VHF47_13955 [Acidimicrobiales bacterium]|nr:hypothetical protein [Acidimicrobiales bacterium]
MNRLAPEQQRLAVLGAALAAVVFVALWAPSYPRSAALAASAIGLVMAAFLYLAARRGSLVLTAIAAFVVSFGPWGSAWMLGAPYIGWSGLLLYRASKAASEAAGPRPPRRKRAVEAEADAPAKTDAPAKRAPERSKRYTPPARKRCR